MGGEVGGVRGVGPATRSQGGGSLKHGAFQGQEGRQEALPSDQPADALPPARQLTFILEEQGQMPMVLCGVSRPSQSDQPGRGAYGGASRGGGGGAAGGGDCAAGGNGAGTGVGTGPPPQVFGFSQYTRTPVARLVLGGEGEGSQAACSPVTSSPGGQNHWNCGWGWVGGA
jgi:hypothetical protein